MTTVGNYSSPTVSVTPGDGTTAATLSIIDPTGVATAGAGVSGSAGGGTWTATANPYLLTMAGDWTERWTVTGTGAGEAERRFYVAPAQPSPDVASSYATTADYANWTGAASIPPNLVLLLRQASIEVDGVLLTAVYDTANTDVIQAIRNATCEQVRWHLERGEVNGIPSGYQSVTIGSVQLGRGYTSAGGESDQVRFSPIAYQLLVDAAITWGPTTDVPFGSPILVQG